MDRDDKMSTLYINKKYVILKHILTYEYGGYYYGKYCN
jgi:hypothetical protein